MINRGNLRNLRKNLIVEVRDKDGIGLFEKKKTHSTNV